MECHGEIYHTLDIDDPLTVQQGANTFYYLKDGLGSVVNLTDSSGNVVKSYIYKGFGEIYSETGSVAQPFTFTGREYDPESGLYYYRARYYDPRAGRFLTKDTIGFAGGDVNLYRYVRNGPANYTDPTGLIGWKGWVGISMVAAGASLSGYAGVGLAIVGGGLILWDWYEETDIAAKRAEKVIEETQREMDKLKKEFPWLKEQCK